MQKKKNPKTAWTWGMDAEDIPVNVSSICKLDSEQTYQKSSAVPLFSNGNVSVLQWQLYLPA